MENNEKPKKPIHKPKPAKKSARQKMLEKFRRKRLQVDEEELAIHRDHEVEEQMGKYKRSKYAKNRGDAEDELFKKVTRELGMNEKK